MAKVVRKQKEKVWIKSIIDTSKRPAIGKYFPKDKTILADKGVADLLIEKKFAVKAEAPKK